MTQTEIGGDAYRVWIDYGEHAPIMRRDLATGGLFSLFQPPRSVCAACGVLWPCLDAVRLERDYSERETARRGDLLRAHGIDADPEPSGLHPDADTPLGRALVACRTEILRHRAGQSARIAAHHVNLLAWHPECGAECSGRNHTEILLLDAQSSALARGADMIASVILSAYGATYVSYETLPSERQAETVAAYGPRAFQQRYEGGEFTPDIARDDERPIAVAVRFYSGAPLDTLRAFVAQHIAAENERAADEAAEKGEQSR